MFSQTKNKQDFSQIFQIIVLLRQKCFVRLTAKKKLIDNIVNTEILKRRMDETDISELFD